MVESSSTPERPGLAAGDVLGQRYRVTERLGAGGMGEVWRAHDLVTDDAVAVKALVLDGRRDDATRIERLLREAKFIARIQHANVVGITDFGQTESGAPWFVMELLQGRPLHELLKAHGPMSWPRAASLATGIANGLAAAHAIGVVHRDLKPANVFVLDDPSRAAIRGGAPCGSCKVIDFGIAKATAVDDRDRALTRTGLVFGTPAYMSPEQARGESLDPRADIYNLGIILHEALTGRRLFSARTPAEILYRQLFEAAPRPSTMMPHAAIPPSIDAIVMRCLAKSPATRFQSMQEVADALAAALRGDDVPMPPREVLPIPPAALRARYGAPRSEISGVTAVDEIEEAPVPTPSSSRTVLRAAAWIAGGVALGLVLVVAAVFGYRAWRVRPANLPTVAEPAEATVPSATYIDDLPRLPEASDESGSSKGTARASDHPSR